jgi:L-ribulose-5-phosphate 3-epimerase
MKYSLGACSWSLKTESLLELVNLVQELGVDRVQLALAPVVHGDWPVDAILEAFAGAHIKIRSGMIGMIGEDYSSPASIRATGGVRCRKHWKANLKDVRGSAAAAHALGIHLVSYHAGWLPHESGHKERSEILSRLSEIADVFGEADVAVALETGQESAQTLLGVLDELDRDNMGVNFDPANMLLYGTGDPVQALGDLKSHLLQVHIKDARRSGDPEVWGEEVVVGTGEVDWPAFFGVLASVPAGLDLMIEREAGSERLRDMRQAREYLLGMGVV